MGSDAGDKGISAGPRALVVLLSLLFFVVGIYDLACTVGFVASSEIVAGTIRSEPGQDGSMTMGIEIPGAGIVPLDSIHDLTWLEFEVGESIPLLRNVQSKEIRSSSWFALWFRPLLWIVSGVMLFTIRNRFVSRSPQIKDKKT